MLDAVHRLQVAPLTKDSAEETATAAEQRSSHQRNSYKSVEWMFFAMASAGLLIALCLNVVDARSGSVLNSTRQGCACCGVPARTGTAADAGAAARERKGLLMESDDDLPGIRRAPSMPQRSIHPRFLPPPLCRGVSG